MKRFFIILSTIIFSLIFVFFPKSETFAQWPSFEVYNTTCSSSACPATPVNCTPYPSVDCVSVQGSASVIARIFDVSGVTSIVANVEDPRPGHEGKYLNVEYPQVGSGIMYDDGNHNDCGPNSTSGIPAGQTGSCVGDGYYGTFFDTSDSAIWTTGNTYYIDVTATDLLENTSSYPCTETSDCLTDQDQTCCSQSQTCCTNDAWQCNKCVDAQGKGIYHDVASFVASLTPEIQSFTVPGEIGSTTISQSNGTISLKVPSGTDLTALVPTIIATNGANVSPISGTAEDFTNPVTYTLTTVGSGTNSYIVTVTQVLSSVAQIVTFTVPNQTGTTTINQTNYTVNLTVPYGTNVTALVPSITLSGGATIVPASGTAEDFTIPKTYTVTAQDGTTTQQYVVTVNFASNTEAQIKTFNFLSSNNSNLASNVTGTVVQSSNTVILVVPSGTNVTNLKPTITLSGGAVISPISGAAENFTNPKTYTVTAQDGTTTQQYVVTVVVGNCISVNGASVCISTSPTTNLNQISSFTVAPTTKTAGQSVTLTANLGTGNQYQTITFTDQTDSVNIGTAVTNASGIATIQYTTSIAASTGNHTLMAYYAGGPVPPSQATATLTITSAGNCAAENGAAVCITTSIRNLNLASSPNPSTQGNTLTLTATLTGLGSGPVTFMDGSTVLGTANLISNVATFPTTSLSAGNHILSAVYGGNLTSNTISQLVTLGAYVQYAYTGAIQTWTVPAGVTSVIIQAVGASGGNIIGATSGNGASMQGTFAVTPGNVLSILVGQSPGPTSSYPGGGGGTFVALGSSYASATPLIVAGGGGGAYSGTGDSAPVTNNGDGTNGGTSGNGAPAVMCGGGGGGFLTNGGNDTAYGYYGGNGFRQGGGGGGGHSSYQAGGFGGGAEADYVGSCNTVAGAGGGYSGGGAYSNGNPYNIGNAGGSYNIGTNQVNVAGTNSGNGSVYITYHP